MVTGIIYMRRLGDERRWSAATMQTFRFHPTLNDPTGAGAGDRELFRAAVTAQRSIAPRHDMARDGEVPAGICLMLEGWAMRYRQMRRRFAARFCAILLPGDLCIDPPGRPLNHAIAWR